MPKKRTSRIYTRERGGARRFYGDFRDLGGGREALVPTGEKLATTDPDVAAELAGARVKELEERKRRKVLVGVEQDVTLGAFATRHLVQKKRDREATDRWLDSAQKHLEGAVAFFGAEASLAALDPADMDRWVEHLRRQENGRGAKLADATVRKYLNSVSNMYARALSERLVRSNPVGDMYTKPTEERREAGYLEPAECALLLESARTYRPPVDAVQQGHGGALTAKPNLYVYPFLATLALTGARFTEAAGLLVDDVSFRLGKVYIRPNDFRRLKTRGSKRSVPLWPQLREILEAYFAEREQSGGLGTLLFPGRQPPKATEGEEAGEDPREQMVTDVRKALDAIAKRAGFAEGSVRPHMLRHTYTAARIQTCDRGRPVALFTVGRELGHSSLDMISDRYGHLHDRAEAGGAEVVEYRIEHYRDQLADRLELLRT